MYLITIIIPIYNAGKHLENTINSVINQSLNFKNIELILVDDNSSDDSRKIIKEYSDKHANICPFYLDENHGFPGFARNVGLKNAHADYIMFLDNDDEYDMDMCKNLYEAITEENADIACCNRITVDFINETKNSITYKNGTVKDDKIIINGEDILFFENISIWNKIYKHEIIERNDIKLLEKTTADDFAFVIEYFLKSAKMVYLNNYYGYRWNIRDDSLSHEIHPAHIEELLKTYRYVHRNLKNNNAKPEIITNIMKGPVHYLIFQSTYLKLNMKSFKGVLNEIYEFENEINLPIITGTKWVNFINHFIIHKHFTISALLLKSVNKIRNFTILRKINRSIK